MLAEQNQSLLEGWIDRIVRVHGGQIVGIEAGGARPTGDCGFRRRRHGRRRGRGGRHMTELVTTVNLAAIYTLLALGISLTWAGLGFLNLAHGVTFAAAGYGAWWAQENISDHASVIFLGGIVVGGGRRG